ncbi:hypothetical protein CJF30_00006594 [Rutstroemia sp. NJR-2017a BBW]|nr:hypothetical protein CJF30_00006594 [Rutstroemia sp. NJR-2017a BBW]
MRLINVSTLALHDFFGAEIPHYAILSHRWETDEITFQDFRDGKGPQMVAWGKVSGCCARAALDGWDYVIRAAVQSFQKPSTPCLNGIVRRKSAMPICPMFPRQRKNPHDDLSSFRKSKWFTRGWTLQELLAPDRVEFFDRDWKPIGTKLGFTDLVQSITGITHLVDYKEASVAQKMSWASKRETTRLEDQAYCLLGLFNVSMPLLYGEGPKAFLRLQQEILSRMDDDTIFAWEGHGPGGLFASSPRLFQGSGDVVMNKGDPDRPPPTMSSKGLGLTLTLLSPDRLESLQGKEIRTRVLAPINCKRVSSAGAWQEPDRLIALVLYRQTGSEIWRRERRLAPVPVRDFDAINPKRTTLVYVPQPTLSNEKNIGKNIDETTGESIVDPDSVTKFRQPVIRTIDWRKQLCQFFDINPDSTDDTLLEELENASEKLKEAARLTEVESESVDSSPRYQVIHRVKCAVDQQVRLFGKEPSIVISLQQRSHLRSDEQIYNLDLYLERNKSISFIVYKDYRCCDSHLQKRLADKSDASDDSDPSTLLISEAVSIISPDLSAALTALAGEALEGIPHPAFLEIREEFDSPYLWWFCRRENINSARNLLDKTHQDHVSVFEQYLNDQFGATWTEVDHLLSEGQISGQYIDYLYSPGMILVAKYDEETIGQQQAYFANSWLRTNRGGRALPSDRSRPADVGGLIEGTYWSFDGTFQKRVEQLNIGYLPSSSITEVFSIRELSFYPIKYAEASLEVALKKRGMMFWKCRLRNYVSYLGEPYDGLQHTDLRFMIDTATYNMMHAARPDNSVKGQSEIGPDMMSRDEPPLDDQFLLCLPKMRIPIPVMLHLLTIRVPDNLDVSRIIPVRWDRELFDSLILEQSAKELIFALVTNQINTKKATDLRGGKGNGLIILLHGTSGPGTGKTLTAESIAEVYEKPLYRVTCGDIGTKPEEVEKSMDGSLLLQYLEAVLLLGRTWDCVILLDEADSFIEQRRTSDLQRNAVVSEFWTTTMVRSALKIREIVDTTSIGILILTSNRVAVFDAAFKSRIQLSLRYDELDQNERLKVWKNFIYRLYSYSSDDGGNIQQHLWKLARAQMNGREIRNAISNARQLAMFLGEEMDYYHIESVIDQAMRSDNGHTE